MTDEKAREDFMNDVYNTLDFLPTNNEANRIIDSFDRVTSGLEQQPCEDCISREATVKTLCKIANYTNESRSGSGDPYIMAALLIQDNKDEFPSVTPNETTGRWEYVQYDGNPNIGNLHCSECDRIAGFEYNFCPNCGARMVSE